MKNSRFLLPGLLTVMTAALSSCDTHDIESAPAGKAIRFAAETELSRAPEITTNNLTEFSVYAYKDNDPDAASKPYMDNVTVRKTSTNVWTYDPVQYWPAAGKLSFYAYAPADWVGPDGPLKAVEWDNNQNILPGLTDIVYAVAPSLNGNDSYPNAQVVFNFRHALSKVTVRMSSTNPAIEVRVSNVALVGLMTKGNFHFPEGSTASKNATSSVGTWSGQNTPIPLVLHLSQSAADLIKLTSTPTDMGDTGWGIGGAKFMIPQLLNWRSNGFGQDTYITVMCAIYDVESGAQIWPNENTPKENIVEGSTFAHGLLKFPLSTTSFSEWRPGYHYIYNLVINSNEEMGTISFGSPSVESFVEVNTTYE